MRILGLLIVLGALLTGCAAYEPPTSPCVSPEKNCTFIPIG